MMFYLMNFKQPFDDSVYVIFKKKIQIINSKLSQ